MDNDVVVNGKKCNANAIVQNAPLPTNDSVYEFVTHAYKGTGGFFTGEYLVKHEKEKKLTRRKKTCYYKNYIKGIVNSVITPVFAESEKREFESEYIKAFLDNCDNKGNSLKKFTKSVVKYATMHGVCFTIMDNFKKEEIPQTRSEAIAKRRFPYLYRKTADTVYDYAVDSFDRFIRIAFKNGTVLRDDKKVPKFIEWTAEHSVEFIIEDDKRVNLAPPALHALGFLPVITTYKDLDSDVMPMPPLYDLARMNYTVFNMDSEQRNLERHCAFPMLAMDAQEHEVAVDVGADSILAYGTGNERTANQPAWISPEAEILTVLNTLSNEVVDKIIEAANVLGATAVNRSTQAKSGVALQVEFVGQSFALKESARLAEEFEKSTIEMLNGYTKEKSEYSVTYQDNYTPTIDEIMKRIELIEKALEHELPEDIATLLTKEMVVLIATALKFGIDPQKISQSFATNSLL